MESHGRPINIGDFRYSAECCAVLLSGLATINSAASYQLDHAPTSFILPRGEKAHGTWVHWDAACPLAPMLILVSTVGSGAHGVIGSPVRNAGRIPPPVLLRCFLGI
jgi:hypothetical protein